MNGKRLVSIEQQPRHAELFAVALARKNPAKQVPRGVGTCAVERTEPHSSSEIHVQTSYGAVLVVGVHDIVARLVAAS
jgi:hypothetical protein